MTNKTKEFLQKLKDSGNWNDNYDYSKVEYNKREDKLIVIDEDNFKHLVLARGLLKGTKLSLLTVSDKDSYLIHKFNLKHNNKYDYSKLIYSGVKTKIKIICPEHGEFNQTPDSHLNNGNGCPKCCLGGIKSDKEQFINKVKEVHGDKYDYSNLNYINSKIKIKINCREHGEFEQTPSSHLKGNGCFKCGIHKRSIIRKKTTKKFIEEAKEIHGDKYDYSLTIYDGIHSNIKIICHTHGVFEQTAINHLKTSGCTRCLYKNWKLTTDEFIQKSKEIHGDKYDYSETTYTNGNIKVKIICPEHGIFEQRSGGHLKGRGCSKCGGSEKLNNAEFIQKSKEIHGDKYDYSLVEYSNSKNKVKIICRDHGMFEQRPSNHLIGNSCPKCIGNVRSNTYEFIQKSKDIHDNKYDYSLVEYTNSDTKVNIVCKNHGEFSQTPSKHLSGRGCPKCSSGTLRTINDFTLNAKSIHGNKYDYSLVDYINSKTKVKIICKIHGEFNQTPVSHLKGSGCPICSNGFTKSFKLDLINNLESSDLLHMDDFELFTIIGQGNLPSEFGVLSETESGSQERLLSIQELKDRLSSDIENDNSEQIQFEESYNVEINPIDEVDIQITGSPIEQKDIDPQLPSMRGINDLHSLDNKLYATMDKEAFESLIQYKLRKLWNNVLNKEISIEYLKNESGGKYFEIIKELFFTEYNEVENYKPKEGYSFKFQPNLMQKLTVNRLLKSKSYGNWSGTGAGKTLSFIVASREIESKLTIIIALNSTIKQTCKVIKEVYPDSITFTQYNIGDTFDRNKHNYLVLNYEKFQQSNSEELFQDLTNNNKIDFVVIDEVHNAKQSDEGEENESIRRGVMTRLLGRIRENNSDLYTLVMSATPVINNLYEAKSLLCLMTGLDFDDLETRKTLSNALKIFQQLILHGLRYIPKYDIEINELTGKNSSNLNINGNHLLDTLLESSNNNYVNTEKLLIKDKLESITPYLRKGVVIYTYLTTGFVDEIEKYVKNLGFTTGTYTGDDDIYFREQNLNNFINGKLDILIGSKPISTGVDGLQDICNRMILITLPWTDSEYTQLKGRIFRQGSKFGEVEFIIPQVRIDLEDGEFWSWDIQRLNLIKNKKTLADVAVDGIIPSKILPSKETMYRKSQESLQKWKDRINNGNIIELKRKKLSIELYPEVIDPLERERRIISELSEFNRRGKTTLSSTMNKEFNENPNSWFRYHKLRKERMDKWDEIPYEYIATKIKNRNHKIIDFGCGENLFKTFVPYNEVISFDHIAFDQSVIACDIKDISEYVDDETIDITIFSLSLWGTNYKDYIKEAHRVLNFGGIIHIAEPIKSYPTIDSEKELIDLITESGFTIVGDIERRSKFIYITGIKM